MFCLSAGMSLFILLSIFCKSFKSWRWLYNFISRVSFCRDLIRYPAKPCLGVCHSLVAYLLLNRLNTSSFFVSKGTVWSTCNFCQKQNLVVIFTAVLVCHFIFFNRSDCWPKPISRGHVRKLTVWQCTLLIFILHRLYLFFSFMDLSFWIALNNADVCLMS